MASPEALDQFSKYDRVPDRSDDFEMPDHDKQSYGKRAQPTLYQNGKQPRRYAPEPKLKEQPVSQTPSVPRHQESQRPSDSSESRRPEGKGSQRQPGRTESAGLSSVKGKGKNRKPARESDADNSVSLQEMVELERKALIRVLQKQREDQQHVAFIFELDTALVDLRDSLEFASQTWKESRPSRGPHPDGELCHIHLHMVRKHIRAYYNTMPNDTDEDARWAETLKGLYNSFNKEDAPREWSTCARKFHPLGQRNKQPQGTWIWLLELDQTTNRGRAAHEWIHDLLSTLPDHELHADGLVLRRERGTVDPLERALRNARIS